MLPSVRIHTWGGLGSQLYALALSIDLETKIRKRKRKFIAHTGGTTKRLSEISFYTRNIKSVDDFTPIQQNKTTNLQFKQNIKKFLKKLISTIGIYAECNNNEDLLSLRPWVTFIRGHYSHRQVSIKSVTSIFTEIQKNYLCKHVLNEEIQIALHYRLGDLEIISEKSPIKLGSIQGKILEIMTSQNYQILNLYSDTPNLAMRRLHESNPSLLIKFEDKSTLETIYECVMSQTFIGTNSKISFWIAIFRSRLKPKGSTYLPLEIKHMMDFQNELIKNLEIKYF
jgi:hypothetical protein